MWAGQGLAGRGLVSGRRPARPRPRKDSDRKTGAESGGSGARTGPHSASHPADGDLNAGPGMRGQDSLSSQDSDNIP